MIVMWVSMLLLLTVSSANQKLRQLWILLLLIIVHPAFAQQFINPRFSRFTINEGLSQSVVYSITQDKTGFMWFGTKDGLNRFDGYEFKIYRHDPFDSTSLSDNTVTTLFSDSKGRLWAGTFSGGLNLYDPDLDCYHHIKAPNLTNANIHAITEDSNGNIWAGSYGSGLFQIIFAKGQNSKPSKIIQFIHDDKNTGSLRGNFIIDVFTDHKGILWISTTEPGIQYINPESKQISFATLDYKVINVPKEIVPGGVRYYPERLKPEVNRLMFTGGWFAEDMQGRLWIGESDGLCMLDEQGNRLLRFDPLMPGLSMGNVRSLSMVHSGSGQRQHSLWIGFFGGAGIMDPNTYFMHFVKEDPANPTSLLPGAVLSICQDRSGCVWIGSSSYGLSKYDARSVLFYLPEFHSADGKVRTEDLSVRSFYDNTRYLLIGCESGLWKADKETGLMSQVNFGNNIGRYNPFYSIQEAGSNNLWLSSNTGLILYNPYNDKAEVFNPNISRNGASENRIFKFYDDKAGHIWCLTPYTFSSFDKSAKTFTNYFYTDDPINAFSEPSYGDIYRDVQGNFWIGTGEGLFFFNTVEKTFTRYVNNPSDTASLSFNAVRCVIPDPEYPEKYLWIGTAGGGLNKMDLQTYKFRHYTIKNGLPNNLIYGILSDKQGRLWMSTNKGISRFDPATGAIQNYTVQSGLQSNEFNSGAFYKNAEGRMFFGGIHGFNAFLPDEIRNESFVPPVVFTGIRIGNYQASIHEKNSPLKKPIFKTQSITLPYNQNNIGLQVAGLDYSMNGQIQYEYKLKGIDKDWVFMGTNRMITFSNLVPGHFKLLVKTANSSKVGSNYFATLQIVITPPWWKTWWAYSIYALVFFGMLLYVRKYDLKRVRLKHNLELKQIEAEKLKGLDHLKSRFFANISHEFRTPLTLIIGPVQDLLEDKNTQKFKEPLFYIQRNAKRLLQLINQLLDLSRLDTGNYEVNTTRDDIIPFVKQMVNSFSSMAHHKNILLETEVDPRLKNDLRQGEMIFYFDEDILEKILYNLLSNAFKFTPNGGNITVSIGRSDNNFLELNVEDSGVGIPEDKLPYIFDRFYQADNSYIRQYEGTGIGLSLVKELVVLHQGTITAQSMQGQPTTFSCYFPFNNKIVSKSAHPKTVIKQEIISHVVSGNAEAENIIDNSRHTVLVAEDQLDVRKYICSKLSETYAVIEAKNGQEGFELAKQHIPDLVVSDVMMPLMDGFELCKLLKTNDFTSHVPVILLTARAEDADKLEGLETGADAYLIKPFNSKELLLRVHNLIELRTTLRKKFSGKLLVKPSEVTVTSQDSQFMQRLLETVEKHIGDENFSVEQLGLEFGMSTSQMNRKLRAIINQSAGEFIRSVRMERAMELLKKHQASIAEVAYETGFSEPAYFSRVFKNHFGFSPSEVKKEEPGEI